MTGGGARPPPALFPPQAGGEPLSRGEETLRNLVIGI